MLIFLLLTIMYSYATRRTKLRITEYLRPQLATVDYCACNSCNLRRKRLLCMLCRQCKCVPLVAKFNKNETFKSVVEKYVVIEVITCEISITWILVIFSPYSLSTVLYCR